MGTRFVLQRYHKRSPLFFLSFVFAWLSMVSCGTPEVGIEGERTPMSGDPMATVAALAAANAHLATRVAALVGENAQQATQVAALATDIVQQASELITLATENTQQASQIAALATENAEQTSQIAALATENAEQASQLAAPPTENAQQATQVAALATESARHGTPTAIPTASAPAESRQWLSAGSMTIPRTLHTATLLPDGRVLLVGGYTRRDVDTSGAEVYDPVSGMYQAAGSLNTARHEHSATLLPDGRVLVIAGYHDGWLGSAEIRDPATGQWSITQPIFSHGTNHTATWLQDGRVLVMAGSSPSGGADSDDRVEIFDPKTNRWEQAATHEGLGWSHTATLLTDGRVLIAGGNADPAIYDPASDTWQPAGRLAVNRWQPQAVRLTDGRVLLVGGRTPFEEERTIDSVEIYDPTSNTWRQVAPLAQARYLHTTTLLSDGRVLVTGGGRLLDNSFDDPGAILGSVEIYDPATDTWSALPPLQQARADHTATLLPDGRVFVAGGWATHYVILDSTEVLKLAGR